MSDPTDPTVAQDGHVEVHQQSDADALELQIRPKLRLVDREQRLDGLHLEHDAFLDDEVGLVRALDPVILVNQG